MCFIHWVTVQCYFVYFVAQIVPALVAGSASADSCTSLIQLLLQVCVCMHMCACTCVCVCVCVEHCFSFWHYKILQTHHAYFLSQPQNQPFSKESGSLYWRTVLEPEFQVLTVHATISSLVILGPLSPQCKEMYLRVCANLRVYPYLCLDM